MRQANWPAVLCCAVLISLSGCATRSPDPAIIPPPDDATRESAPAAERLHDHDFGSVLAQGQLLRHEFNLANPTRHPIRVLKASSSAPCCSSIDPLPRLIAPHSTVPVKIALRTENKSGLLRVAFGVETDDAAAPLRRFTASVLLIPEWEIQTEREPVRSLGIGQGGRQECRVVCRRNGKAGWGVPVDVKVSGPVKAALGGSIEESIGPAGITEASREVEVELLASSQPGFQQGEVLFQWPDGRTQSHVVTWEVRPRIKASPSGLVLRRSRDPLDVSITVASEDRPIRIIKVDGPLFRPHIPAAEARQRHALHLVVDGSKTGPEGISDIKVTTDHPDQPEVSIAVLLVDS